MATRPAIAPETNPREEGLPCIHEAASQASAPIAAAVLVTRSAFDASPSAASALPPLKPNQPNQSSPAPRSVMGILVGSNVCWPKPTRLPITSASASAPKPALMCTTVPPAKSSAPRSIRKPPPQTQCASGS